MSKNLRIRVQPILKGTWDSSIPYTPMDVVSTGGGSYYWCLKENTGKNPDDDKDKEFWLEVGSDSSNFVQKSGDTMTGNLTIDKSSPSVLGKIPEISITDISIPSTIYGNKIQTLDKNGELLGSCDFSAFSSGNFAQRFRIYRKIEGELKDAEAGLYISNAGATWFYIPTPPLSSTSDYHAVTAYWVNQKLGSGTKTASLVSTLSLMNDVENDSAVEQTLNDKKSQVISQINSEVQQAIYSGFPYEIDGKEYLFGTSLFDQQNFNDLISLSLISPEDTFSIRCTDMDTGRDIYLDLSASKLQEVYKFIVGTKQSILRDANDKKDKIFSATNEDEINKIYNS